MVLVPISLRCGRYALTHAARLGIVAAVVFTAALGLATDVRSLFLIASVEGLDAIWDTELRVRGKA